MSDLPDELQFENIQRTIEGCTDFAVSTLASGELLTIQARVRADAERIATVEHQRDSALAICDTIERQCDAAQAEVERLKGGDFTPEEFEAMAGDEGKLPIVGVVILIRRMREQRDVLREIVSANGGWAAQVAVTDGLAEWAWRGWPGGTVRYLRWIDEPKGGGDGEEDIPTGP